MGWPDDPSKVDDAVCSLGVAQACHTGRVELVEAWEVWEKPDGSIADQKGTSRKQYINLDRQRAYPEWGRRIRLRARIRAEGTARLSGVDVYFLAKPASGNRSGLILNLRHGFDSPGGHNYKSSKTDVAGWTGVVDFYLSQYGGDAFELSASLDPTTPTIPLGTYTVWRRIFYELDCMKRPSGGGTYVDRAKTGDMESKMRDLFLELVRTGTDASPAHKRVVTDAEGFARGVRDGGVGSTRYFHLVLLDTVSHSSALVENTFTLNPGVLSMRYSAENWTLDSSNWYVSASFTQGTNTGNVPLANLTLTEDGTPSEGNDAFVVTLNPAGLGIDATKAFTIKLSVISWKPLSGVQTPEGPTTTLGMRWRERRFRTSAGDIANSTLNTMMHEPGHAMGLAPKSLPDGNDNPDQYALNGSHCHALSNGCVMYEANSTHVDFCPHCKDGLRARNLASLPINGGVAGY